MKITISSQPKEAIFWHNIHTKSTLYLSEDTFPHSTYMWHRSWTSDFIKFIWLFPFLISFIYSFLYYTMQDTLPLTDVTRLRSRCALVCSAKTGEWYYISSIKQTLCHVSILLLLCTVLTISISIRILKSCRSYMTHDMIWYDMRVSWSLQMAAIKICSNFLTALWCWMTRSSQASMPIKNF